MLLVFGSINLDLAFLARAVFHDLAAHSPHRIVGFEATGPLPVVADDDRSVWEWCLRGAGVVDVAEVRAARIVDTLHCTELWVTDRVLDDLRADAAVAPRLDVLASGLDLVGPSGELAPFDG